MNANQSGSMASPAFSEQENPAMDSRDNCSTHERIRPTRQATGEAGCFATAQPVRDLLFCHSE